MTAINKYLGVVDADSILYRVAYSCQDETEEKAIDTMRAFIYTNIYLPTKCTKYIFVLSGGESGRSEIAVTKPYKGQRSTEKPKHLEVLKQAMIDQYNAIIVEDYEADDVVVAICNRYNPDCVLMGIDKDAKQLSCEHFNYVKQESFFVTPKEAQYYFFKQMITGDTVDNIPGVPKMGEKKAEKLFKDNPEVPPAKLVRDLYDDLGLGYEYFEEQYRLLYMLRDIPFDYEDAFISFDELYHDDITDNSELEEFDFE